MSKAEPLHLNNMFEPEYAVPSFGFIVPPLALVIGIINGCMIWVLTRPNIRSPVNILLVFIAWSDMLTVFLPVPPFIYFYTLGNYKDFVPFWWCRVFFYCVHVFPLLSNMASLWATVALAFMRCYSVWRPLLARSRITMRRTCIVMGAIYVLSFLVYSPITFEYSYTPLSTESMSIGNSTFTTCHMQKDYAHLPEFFCVLHTWIQIIFTSLLPWFLITFPNFGLLWKLRKTEDDRKMLRGNCSEKEEINKESTMTPKDGEVRTSVPPHRSRGRTITTVICVTVSMVWIVEIPFGIVFTRYLAHSDGDVMRTSIGSEVVFVFLLKYVTYPIIFLLYCLMSGNFRETLKKCFFCISNDGYSVTRSTISREKRESEANEIRG